MSLTRMRQAVDICPLRVDPRAHACDPGRPARRCLGARGEGELDRLAGLGDHRLRRQRPRVRARPDPGRRLGRRQGDDRLSAGPRSSARSPSTRSTCSTAFVGHYHGAAETGLYGVAFRYSQIVLVGVFAFRMGWPQWHYSWLNSDRHPQMAARGASWFFGALGFLVGPSPRGSSRSSTCWDARALLGGHRGVVPLLSIAAMATGAYAVTAAG